MYTTLQCLKPSQGCVRSHDPTMQRSNLSLAVWKGAASSTYQAMYEASPQEWDWLIWAQPTVHPHSPLFLCIVGGLLNNTGQSDAIHCYKCASKLVSVCVCQTHHPVKSDHVFPIVVVEWDMTFHHLTQWVDVLPRSPTILFCRCAVM